MRIKADAREIPVFIGVDFDFFIYFGLYDKARVDGADPSTGRKRKIHGIYLFDWAHSESQSAKFQELLWKIRAADFEKWGLRMEDVATIRTDFGCVLPEIFIEKLATRFEIPGPLLYSDSHAHAYSAAQITQLRLGKKRSMDLLLFDAHHDLGNPDTVVQEKKEGWFNCGSWAFHAAEAGIFDKICVVFPDWKGMIEWPNMDKWSHLRTMRDRLSCTTWTKWCGENILSKRKLAAGIHVARSATWTPPHTDAMFSKFMSALGAATNKPPVCMDCYSEPKIGPWDACVERAAC